MDHLGDFFHRVLYAGRSLVMDKGDQIIFLLLESLCNHLRQHCLPHWHLNLVGWFAVGDGAIIPTLGERTINTCQHAFFRKVAYGSFLRTAARIGHDENAILGEENLAKFLRIPLENGFKIFAAVRHHGLGLLL